MFASALTYCWLWIQIILLVTGPSLAENASNTSSALERRDDPPRFTFIGCNDQQRAYLELAAEQLTEWALAAHRVSLCPNFPQQYDPVTYFFKRDREVEMQIVSAMSLNLLRKTVSASRGGTSRHPVPVRCAPVEDIRCNSPQDGVGSRLRLAYTDHHDLGALATTFPEFTDDNYLSIISICPRAWNQVQRVPPMCQPGVDQGSMPDTLTSVLYTQMVHVITNLAAPQAGTSLTPSYTSVEECKMLNTGDVQLATYNAPSHMYMAYLAWRAGWASTFFVSQQMRDIFQQCIIAVFGPERQVQQRVEQAGMWPIR